MDFQQGSDYTNSYRSTRRATDGLRAAAATTYALGGLVKLADATAQVYSDGATVIPTTAAAAQKAVAVVSEDWNGFDGNGGLLSAGTSAASTPNIRGSQTIKGTVYGYHPAVLIDNTNAGATTCSQDSILTSSQNAAGKVQSTAAAAAIVGAIVGRAILPSSGFGSTALGSGAVTAASQTYTVTGSPAAGDVYSITLAIPFAGSPGNVITPGVAQTKTISVTLNSTTAATVTTAALAILTAINADPVFKTYYLATQSAGAITVTVVAAQFFITVTNSPWGFFYLTTSGTIGNALTIAGAVVGTGTLTVGGANFASGAGYVGTVPAMIMMLGC